MIEIQNDAQLAEMCRAIKDQPFFTFDTEFIRERTYFPILALVQVSWQDQEPILIDPLTITDWAPFHDLLLDENIVKVFHAGRQDLEIFYEQMKEMPRNLFDTQIAASLTGLGDQVGYSVLVNKLLKVHLAKGSSFTNWLHRPLTESQLRYARDDVAYLPEIYHLLVTRAESQNRATVVLQEIDEQLHEGLFKPDPKQLWRRVKKSGGLRPKDLIVLQDLTAWRDELARKLDRPVRYILADEALVELCKSAKLTRDALKARRGVNTKLLDRHADEILDLHEAARAKPKEEWPSHGDPDKAPSETSEALADLAWILIKEIGRKNNMAPNNIILKRDIASFIEAYCRGDKLAAFPVYRGWRKDLVGESLIRLIEGKLVIKVHDQRITWEDSQDS